MVSRSEFQRNHAGVFFLDPSDRQGLTQYLRQHDWLGAEATVRDVRRAGEGNMNCALRVSLSQRSVILKQSRPWVEKYPQIAAPIERALLEGQFYQLVSSHPPVARMMPQLLGFDPTTFLLVLEDLGQEGDFTSVYSGRTLGADELESLTSYLNELHSTFLSYPRKPVFSNRAMRQLNHEHIFHFPLVENGLDLDDMTPGLGSLASELKRDAGYVHEVTRLGGLYLQDGPALLHGDFFPGSWLETAAGVRVIDPEFCFFGPPEFDVGVMTAHLILSKQDRKLTRRVLELYRPSALFDRDLAARFAAVEMMRRLIGVAQLPLAANLDDKQKWLEHSRRVLEAASPWEAM